MSRAKTIFLGNLRRSSVPWPGVHGRNPQQNGAAAVCLHKFSASAIIRTIRTYADIDRGVARKTAVNGALRVKLGAEASIVLPGHTAFSYRSEVVKAETKLIRSLEASRKQKLSASRIDIDNNAIRD